VKAAWNIRQLGEVCNVQPRKSEARQLLRPNDMVSFVPMEALGIQRKEIGATVNRTLSEVQGSYTYFANGDVLLAKITPCFENGKLGIASGLTNGVGFGSSEYIVLRPLACLTANFLYYFLLQDSFRETGARNMTGTAGQKRVTKTYVESSGIPTPPLKEQERIVAILDEAFEGIATAKANAEESLKKSNALLGILIEAMLSKSDKPALRKTVGEIANLARGQNPPKHTFSPVPKPGYIRFYQIRDGKTEDYAVYVPDTPQLHKVESHEILMVAYRHIGKAYRGVTGAFNVALCKLTNARKDLVHDDYLFELIPSSYIRGELLKRSERSLIPSMSIEHLREIEVPIPSLSEQSRILSSLSTIRTEQGRLAVGYTTKLDALEELKQSLLHQAFTGKL